MLKLNDIMQIREDLEVGWKVFSILQELIEEKEKRLQSSVNRLKVIERDMTSKLLLKQKAKRMAIKRKEAK
tara:strand:+ start:197 stop:409 length:213 start_codon:yes stop_codon:yes gene_type:complete